MLDLVYMFDKINELCQTPPGHSRMGLGSNAHVPIRKILGNVLKGYLFQLHLENL